MAALAKSKPLPGYVLSLLRIVTSLLFTFHGLQKFGMFGGLHGHKVAPFTLLWVGAVLEAIGGPLILLGLFTRPIAFLLSGEMAVAYFTTHAPRGVWPIVNGGELGVLYCWIFFYLFAAGPGPLSLDRLLKRA